MAELFQGHGRELDDFVTLYIGAAIGGGVVLGGDYRRGATGNAGDIGLMPVPPSRLPPRRRPTRPLDILLTRASVNSLVRHLRATAGVEIADRAGLDEAVAAAPGAGARVARGLRRRAGRAAALDRLRARRAGGRDRRRPAATG